MVEKPEIKKKSIIVLICPLKAVRDKTDATGNKIRHSLKYRNSTLYSLKGINEIRGGKYIKWGTELNYC